MSVDNLFILNELLSENAGHLNITVDELMAIQEKLHSKTVLKGEAFCKEGEVCNELGIMISGLLFAYYDSPKSSESVSRFFFQPVNPIVTSFDSFKKRTKSLETIEAIEDSHLLCISNDDLEDLYHKFPPLLRLGKEFSDESYIKALRKTHELRTLDAKEKVRSFLKDSKELLNRANRQDIASYLGMTDKTFRLVLKELNNE